MISKLLSSYVIINCTKDMNLNLRRKTGSHLTWKTTPPNLKCVQCEFITGVSKPERFRHTSNCKQDLSLKKPALDCNQNSKWTHHWVSNLISKTLILNVDKDV